MRTGPRKWRELMREIDPSLRTAINVIDGVKEVVRETLNPFGFGAVEFNCYRNSQWELSALPPKGRCEETGGCRWISMQVDMKSFIKDPTDQINEFLNLCDEELKGHYEQTNTPTR